jgi:hypothetical protein
MKRIINTILISAVAALSFSCQVKEEISVPMNESIVLDLSSGLTKADHNSTESFVNHIDVFIFEAVSGTPAGGRHYGRYVVNNASSLTLDAKRSDFDQSKKYYVYLIANSVIEESEFAEYTDHNTLLNKLQEDRFLHLTGLDATNAPKYFLMDAVAEDADGGSPVQLNNGNPADDTVLSAQLRRAAAKVVINIVAGEKVEFMPYTLAEGSEGGLYYVRNLPYQTYLLAEAKAAEDISSEVRNTSKSDSEYFTWSPETDSKNVSLTTYVYPHSWSNSSILEEETCVVMNLPLNYTDDQGNVHIYHNSWYKIPMTDDKMFERNNYYEVNVNLNRPGAVAETTPENVDNVYYAVEDWVPVSVNVGGETRPDYLQLNTDHVDIYNENSDDSSLRFASSTPIPADGITLLEAYYYNYLDQKVNLRTSDPYRIYSQIRATAEQNVLNGGITINSPFFSATQEYHSNAIRYLKFRVQNSSGQTAEFTVAQYPTLYITNEHGLYSYRSDFGGTNYNDGIGTANRSGANWNNNGTWSYSSTASNNYFFGSKVAKTSGSSYTINYAYYSIDRFGAVSLQTNYISGLDNPRMYHVHVTATSSKYIVARPRLDARGYTESSPENTQLVSPSFMIASQLGATQSPDGGVAQAKSHCEQYIEVASDGTVYDDWRLPTAAEIDIIIKHQDISDAMAVVLSGPEYYCAYNTDSQGNVVYTKATGKSGTHKAVRCIRDAY